MELPFERPIRSAMPPPAADPQGVEEFFGIEPGAGPVTRLDLADQLRNPWGILHGGAVATLADVAACRAVAAGRAVAGTAPMAPGPGTRTDWRPATWSSTTSAPPGWGRWRPGAR